MKRNLSALYDVFGYLCLIVAGVIFVVFINGSKAVYLGASPQAQIAPRPAGAALPSNGEPVLTVDVVKSGYQKDIGDCIGAINYLPINGLVAEHNYCGGDRYHRLYVGDKVRLTGEIEGVFEVVEIYDSVKGSIDYKPGYHLQTSLDTVGNVRLWRLNKVQ